MLTATNRRNRLIALFATLAVGGMALFFNLYDPWMAIGSDLILDSQFETSACRSEWTGWSAQGARREADAGENQSGGVVLTAQPGQHGTLKKTIENLQEIPALRINVRAATDQVERGKHYYSLPRAILFYRNAHGKGIFNRKHTVFCSAKPHDWTSFSRTFPVPSDARSAQVELQNLGSRGTVRIDAVSITPVGPRPSRLVWNAFFLTLWGAALALSLWALAPWNNGSGRWAMLCMALILIGVLLPGKTLNQTILDSEQLAKQTVRELRPKPKSRPPQITSQKKSSAPVSTPPKKSEKKRSVRSFFTPRYTLIDAVHHVGHMGLFLLLTLFSLAAWAPPQSSSAQTVAVLAGIFLFAASSELLQFVAIDRGAGLHDLAVDALGAICALPLSAVLRWGHALFVRRRAQRLKSL